MPCLKNIGARLYYAALFLCPPAFRREFSSEMTRDFHEATREAGRAGRRRDLLALWAGIGADLARTLVVQWLRTGAPVLVIGSVASAIAATRVATNVLLREPLPVPASAHDRDLMTLMLLTGTVLAIIVATIVFTFWFSRPLFGRHRR